VLQYWLPTLFLFMIPGVLALSALGLNRPGSQQDPRCFGIIGFTVQFCTVAAISLVVWLVLISLGLVNQVTGQLVSLTPLRAIMLALVLGQAAVLLHFSRNYILGEACYQKYFRWLLLTVAAVCLTMMANHLLLFVLGWAAVSVSLHQLLTLYPERPRAILAAHKKFILARVAELCLLTAALLLVLAHDSVYIDQILQQLTERGSAELSGIEQAAALLFAVAALIKSGQLPFHGWLIKVVEVPTPISALLHAGVINLGGFMLLMFAPLFARADPAQWLVLIVAGISTVLSVLIMTTRISVKVRLAWSTSAQMGLMLIEIALGLYELALLHLLAHSVYKAYAFLSAGNAVSLHVEQTLLSSRPPLAATRWMAVTLAIGCIVLGVLLSDYLGALGQGPLSQGPLSPWLLLGIGLMTLMANLPAEKFYKSALSLAGVMLLLTLSYVLLKQGLAQIPELAAVAGVSSLHHPLSLADLWAMMLFAMVAAVSHLLNNYAAHPFVQRLSTVLFAGLYLDEWFTRVTLRIWPVSLPRTQQHLLKP
jgi:NAD(P)H-quinone oxidoreductase subunit 5